MHFDIFNDDAFTLSQLTLAMTNLPHQPGRIGQLGLFAEEGISTLSVDIESIGTTLSLVPAGVRGQRGTPVRNDKRTMRSFRCIHLPQSGAVNADEFQSLRAFGSETEVETAQGLLNKKFTKLKRNIDATLEWGRMGAIKGQVLDSDGTTVLLNLFTDFGVTQTTQDDVLDNTATKVKQKCTDVQRLIEAQLGGLMYTGIRNLCSPSYFDALTTHPAVEAAYDRWQSGEFLRTSQRDFGGGGGFWFCGQWFEEYRGKVGAIDFIADGEAYAIPEGVPDLFVSYFGPADYMETVNTIGLPYYAKQWAKEGGKGIELEAQSNPLHLCTRPAAIVKRSI